MVSMAGFRPSCELGKVLRNALLGCLTLTAALLGLCAVSYADQIADFYSGKRITLVVAAPAGSGYDFGARIFARHFGRHVPGNPALIVQNMPGGGGRTGTAYVYSAAPRDGTVIAAVQSFIPVDQLFEGDASKPLFDPRQFNWLGSIANSTSVAVSWHKSKVKTWEDLFTTELVVGGVGAATPMVTFPYLFKRLLGMKFRIVSGYLGGPDVDLAMERGEVEGRVDYSWHTLKATREDWLKEGKLNPLFQMGLAKHPDLQDIPLLIDLVKEPEQKQILEVAFLSYEFGRAFLTTPGTPMERVIALREAFEATMKDPDFLAEAENSKLEVSPVGAERLQTLVQTVYAMPASLISRVATLQKPDSGGPEVQFKTVRAKIVEIGANGKAVVKVSGGDSESVQIDDGRTKITVARQEAKRSAVGAGMTCAISYLGDRSTAKSLDCD